MVSGYKTSKGKTKGKWCHFEKEDFKRHGLEDYYWKQPDQTDIMTLKERVVDILESEGFVFFGEIEHQVITHFGKLHEFAVNYFHIK